MTAIVRGGKWSSIELHFLSIALLDWTIKQKRQNRNMGYVCVFVLSVKCEASHNNIVKVDFFYTVRAGTAQEETENSAKKKKQYVGF